MSIEKWEKWKPISFNKQRTEIKKIIFNDDIIIEIEGEKEMLVEIFFEFWPLSFRISDEGNRLKTFSYVHENYGKEFYVGWPFYRVENSEYIKWFIEDNYGTFEKSEIKHLVIMTSNHIIDILTNYMPKVRVIS